ncbi:MAG: alpha-amylase family glycosyl hydrolase [Bacteroidales bacterium]|jgi:alpha-amylase|nr:alpha-amylase family glycosyl hydrolase [Bacteroidales bacterium]
MKSKIIGIITLFFFCQMATHAVTQYGQPFASVPAIQDIVMYEVNLNAFDKDKSFRAVENRLDEIKALGVNVIWLMPIYPIGEEKSVGSPYAVKDYFGINKTFGNKDDLRRLVSEAHSRGMAVILDWVANHTAWDNPWVSNTSWYTQDKAGNIVSPLEQNWSDVADLDYSNVEMQNEMIRALKFWILEANVDGYRCDYATGVPADFWKRAIDTLHAMPQRELIMFAESDDKALFNAGFDIIFGWNYYNALHKVYTEGNTAEDLMTANTQDYAGIADHKEFLRFTTNHDDNIWDDLPQNVFTNERGAITAFVLSAFRGGIPLIYNGQEVGCEQKLGFFAGNSTYIDWSANPDILQEYKDILKLRTENLALSKGSLTTFNDHTDIASFLYQDGTEEMLIIANVRDQKVNYTLPTTLANSMWHNGITHEPVELGQSITLEAFDYLLLTSSNVEDTSSITIRLKKYNNWDKVYLYGWKNDEAIIGSWPGVQLQEDNGWFSYTISDTTANVIFTNNSGEQTINLFSNDDMCYEISGGVDASQELLMYSTDCPEVETTSTFTNRAGADIEIYPNPASSSITIVSPDGLKRVQIYSILGTLLQQKEVDTHQLEIDTSELKSGTYLTAMMTDDKKIRHKKIIIKKQL